MMSKPHKTETVKGHTLPAPRVTRAGYWAMVLYGALPALGALLLIDLALWAYFRFALDRCYGLWCFFG